jgi:hypothetical protein
MVERAGAEAGLALKAHPHMLRHACGYALANKGHDARSLQAYLGHRNIQHTVRYTELSPMRFKISGASKRKSLSILPSAFQMQISPEPCDLVRQGLMTESEFTKRLSMRQMARELRHQDDAWIAEWKPELSGGFLDPPH